MKKLNSRLESTTFKILSLFGLAVLAFCLSACSNSSGGGSDNGEPPVITTTSLPDEVLGAAYSEILTATGTAPITWTLDSGSLPDGLNLASNGTISGTSTSDGTFNFTVKAGNIAGSDTKNLSILIYTPELYIITGSGAAFTATNDGLTIGTAGQSIQAVIDAIKTHAAGKNCEIQFGDGGILDIGMAHIEFNGGVGGNDWGIITLLGKISSAYPNYDEGTILLHNNVSIEVEAEIANTASASGIAICNASLGAVNIKGGTVEATTGYAVYNRFGTLSISGGTVEATTGTAVYTVGEVNISGGTVKATTGEAISNMGAGKITI